MTNLAKLAPPLFFFLFVLCCLAKVSSSESCNASEIYVHDSVLTYHYMPNYSACDCASWHNDTKDVS